MTRSQDRNGDLYAVKEGVVDSGTTSDIGTGGRFTSTKNCPISNDDKADLKSEES